MPDAQPVIAERRAPLPAAVDLPPPGKDDAVTVTGIIKAFSDLKNPVVRERLLGLLQALA